MRKQRKEKTILEYSTLEPVKDVSEVGSPILDQIEHDEEEAAKSKEPRQVCDFCGKSLLDIGLAGGSTKDRRKYCSERCRSRAQRGLTAVRLDIPLSKRYKSRLKFSSPLYFD